jgi:hypothetical protein
LGLEVAQTGWPHFLNKVKNFKMDNNQYHVSQYQQPRPDATPSAAAWHGTSPSLWPMGSRR